MNQLKFYALIAITFFCFFSCGSDVDSSNSAEDSSVNTDAEDIIPAESTTLTEAPEKMQSTEGMTTKAPELPPVTAVKDSIQKKMSAQSVFYDLGCCQKKEERKKKCCCDAVLKKYTELVEKDDPKLAKYNMTDPILGACKRAMPIAFDEVDNPPSGEGEDDYDDMF